MGLIINGFKSTQTLFYLPVALDRIKPFFKTKILSVFLAGVFNHLKCKRAVLSKGKKKCSEFIKKKYCPIKLLAFSQYMEEGEM